MEVCVRFRTLMLVRRRSLFFKKTCLRRELSAFANSAETDRNDGGLSRLEIRRERTVGSRYNTAWIFGDSQRFSSSLFTTSEEGESVPFVLKPDFDFSVIFRDRDRLEQSIIARKMEEINISEMIQLWEDVCDLEEQKNQLERKKKALNIRSKELNKQKGDSSTQNKIQQEGRKIRETVKGVNSSLNALMNQLYPLALSLPNLLHDSVPVGDMNVEKEKFGDDLMSLELAREHPDITTHNPLVHPAFRYTEGDFAMKELDVMATVSSHLSSNGFTRFSMPDMFKPLTMEALGLKPENTKELYAFETRENVMFLAGASPMGFLAYYMMSVLEAGDLPHRCFAVGRHYNASAGSAESGGIHNQFQDSRVEFFGVSEGKEESSDALLSQYLHTLKEIISNFGVPYRIVNVASEHLQPSMHRMMAVEVWMPRENQYVEVANICNCTDFISRRLKIRYPTNPRESAAQSRKRSFVHTIHGTALKSSVLLASMLEHGKLDLKS